jgi:hypothetical protein
MGNWKHHKTIADNDKFELNGLNIWDFIWESIKQSI